MSFMSLFLFILLMLLMLLLLKYNLGMVESLLKVHWLSSFVLLLDRGRVVVEEAEELVDY